MASPPEPKPLPLGEFAVLMAMLTSLVALGIDSLLPALPADGPVVRDACRIL